MHKDNVRPIGQGPMTRIETGAGAGLKSTQELQLDPRDCQKCLLQESRLVALGLLKRQTKHSLLN